jgi:hypothetical protein
MMLIGLITIFTFLVFGVAIIKGRAAALTLMTVCGAMIAFLMPPFYSLQVSRTRDLFALAFYGTAGLVLTQTAQSRKQRLLAQLEVEGGGESWTPVRKRFEADLAHAVANLSSSEPGVRLRELALAIAVDGCALPCTVDETFRILSDAVNAALAVPDVQRISIYAAQRPSARLLKVVAHRVWPMPENEIVMTGRREANCVPAQFPGWPPQARANWFDNGYDRIYQIWVEDPVEEIEAPGTPDSAC